MGWEGEQILHQRTAARIFFPAWTSRTVVINVVCLATK